jgi:putative hemolysin
MSEGVDRDAFDPYCDHLMVRDNDTHEVVGTYRILPASQAQSLGRFYFDCLFGLN